MTCNSKFVNRTCDLSTERGGKASFSVDKFLRDVSRVNRIVNRKKAVWLTPKSRIINRIGRLSTMSTVILVKTYRCNYIRKYRSLHARAWGYPI
jgi:hypothetical protein